MPRSVQCRRRYGDRQFTMLWRLLDTMCTRLPESPIDLIVSSSSEVHRLALALYEPTRPNLSENTTLRSLGPVAAIERMTSTKRPPSDESRALMAPYPHRNSTESSWRRERCSIPPGS